MPLVTEWQEVLRAELDVRLVSIGGRAETATAYPHQADRMWFDEEQGYGRLGIPGTPRRSCSAPTAPSPPAPPLGSLRSRSCSA